MHAVYDVSWNLGEGETKKKKKVWAFYYGAGSRGMRRRGCEMVRLRLHGESGRQLERERKELGAGLFSSIEGNPLGRAVGVVGEAIGGVVGKQSMGRFVKYCTALRRVGRGKKRKGRKKRGRRADYLRSSDGGQEGSLRR